MDQSASVEAVGSGRQAGRPGDDGLGEQVAAVEAARARLGSDLDRLTVEVRAQMEHTVEKTMWKGAAAGAGVLAGLVVRKLFAAIWKAARHQEPPANPASPGTSWGEATAWTLATAAGVGVAKLVAVRGAAMGWQKAMGTVPPGLEEE